jgi:antitoxin component HigA of HigAB toxin-antitoxin module
VLSELIDAYDRANHPMPRRRGTAHQRLLALVESSHTTPSKLQKILALSQPQVSLILAGKRGLSKTSALRLARHFNLGTDYFLQDQ